MNIFFFIFLLIASTAQAKQIVLDIPDNDIKIVENDVFDAEKWIKDAWAGKLAKCKSRLVASEVAVSVKNGETLPAGEDAIVQKAFSRTDYKSRSGKESISVSK